MSIDEEETMKNKALFIPLISILLITSFSCVNPIQSYFYTQTAIMDTATATMWTPTPTFTPTNTNTPTRTPTPTPTYTSTRNPNLYYETNGDMEFAYLPPNKWIKTIDEKSDIAFWNGPNGCVLAFFPQKSSMPASMFAAIEQENLKDDLNYYNQLEEGVYESPAKLEAFWFSFIMGGNKYVAVYIFSDGQYLLESIYIRPPACSKNENNNIEDTMQSLIFL